MIKVLLATSALALSTAAIAQTPQTEMPADPTTSAVTQPATPPAETTTTTPTEPTTAPETAIDSSAPATETTQSADAAAAPANSSDTVTRVVDAEWANYDGDGDGELSKADFSRWITALRTSQGDEGDHAAYAEAAFVQADADKNSTVSKTELTTFLQG